MNPCHFSQTRPRSRSASPTVSLENEDYRRIQDQQVDGHDDSGATLKPCRLTVASHDNGNFESGFRPRSHSWRRTPPPHKLNQHLVNSHPVHLLVTTDESTTNDFNFLSHGHHGDRELLVGRRSRRYSDGDMTDPDTPTPGQVRNYGSLNSTPFPSGGDGRSDSQETPSEGSRQPSSSRLKRQKSYYTPAMVDELRKRNGLYFLDPITKLRYFHGFPWKLTLQIVKIILITAQILYFGAQRESIVEYFERTELTMKHLLLLDWDPSFETMPYPPATGQYAIYTMDELSDHMDNILEQYYKLPKQSLAAITLLENKQSNSGPFPIQLCFRANSFHKRPNVSYYVSDKVLENCTDIYPLGPSDNHTYDVFKYIHDIGFHLPFNRTLDITLRLYISTYHLNLLQTHYGPTCYNLSIEIKYLNSERSGQLLTSLSAKPTEIKCEGPIMSDDAKDELDEDKTQNISYDACVMAICALSTILCSRSLHRSHKLRADTAKYFHLHRGKPFSFSNHVEYINIWYIIIICNDILTLFGSAFKIQLESRVFSISSKNYELCSIFLGLGTFLTYVGILRYLGFFKSYNVLILTLKTSFPHVMRFLVCAICLYTGFLFCGWVVFSPYHIKFRKLSTTSECLYSLVNGDDMFVTFSALTTDNNAIWYFHRAYLYIFISLFIYVVLSVFIAVIMDNYECLKYWYEQGFPDSEVQKFMKECGEMTKAELFSHVRGGHTCANWFFCIFPCLACFRRKSRNYQYQAVTPREPCVNNI